MAVPRSSCGHLFYVAVLGTLVNGCSSLQSADVTGASKVCAHSSQTEVAHSTPSPTRTQIARSFSGGPPSAGTRVVWITREDPCL
jgi:hypothetical protein